MIATFGNIQVIELLFTTIACFGLIFALLNFRKARSVYNHLKEVGITNGRIKLAKFSQTTDGVRALIQGLFVTVGLISFMVPPTNISELPPRLQISSHVLRWGFVLATSLTALQSYNSYRFQKQFKQDNPDYDSI